MRKSLVARIIGFFKFPHYHKWDHSDWNAFGIAQQRTCKCGAVEHRLHTTTFDAVWRWEAGPHPDTRSMIYPETQYTVTDPPTRRVMQTVVGKGVQEAISEYGDVLCESCDAILAREGQTIMLGHECWRCNTKVVRFDPW